tara:strand:+ start:1484 stop:1987 length:504 start_codon:yes stop_codon:yes gene_type:complete
MIYKIFIFLLLFSNLSYSDNKNQLLLHKEPKKLEQLELFDMDGKKYVFSSKTNKTLIINFWATWCPPCIKEIPELIELKKKLNNEIEILFVSVDQNATKIVPKFLKKNNLSDIKVFNDQTLNISQGLDVTVMPTSIVIDKNFEEISRVIGYIDWLNEESISFVKENL